MIDTHMMTQAAQAVGAIGLLGTGLGVVLGVAARYLSAPVDDRAEAVAAILPGSNCAQCGFAGCKRAAAAIVDGRAAPNVCPPGGASTALRVAEMIGVRLAVDGSDAALPRWLGWTRSVALGAPAAYANAPTDAIVGAIKQMHTVLPEACYACGLCEIECPTKAIVMKPVCPR